MVNLTILLLVYSSTIVFTVKANESTIESEHTTTNVIAKNECRPTLDVIFLLDTSHSVKDIFKDQVQWANALVSLLPVARDGVHVGAIQYAGLPLVEFALNTYTASKDVEDHIKHIEHRSGVTRTGSALRKAKEELYNSLRGGRLLAKKLIVLMTDGVSIDDPKSVAEEIRNEYNITILTVALAKDPYLPELSAITGNESLCFRNSDQLMLKAHVLNMMKEILDKCRHDKAEHNVSTTPTVSTSTTATSTVKTTSSTKTTVGVDVSSVTTITVPVAAKLNLNQSTSSFSTVTIETTKEGYIANGSTTPKPIPSSTIGSTTQEHLTTTEHHKNDTSSLKAVIKVTGSRVKNGRKCISSQLDSVAESLDGSNCVDETNTKIIVDEKIPSNNLTVIDESRVDVQTFPEKIANNETEKEQTCAVNVLFLLDSSSSTTEEFLLQKQIIKEIVDLLTLDPKHQRVALMQFSGYLMQQPVVSFDPYQSNYFINDAIDGLQQLTGTSYIGAALTFARNMLYRRREDAKTVVMLVSDGYSQDDAVQPAEILKNFYASTIYAMTMSKEHDRSYLSRITGSFDNVFIGDYQLQYFKENFKKKLVNCNFHHQE